MSPRSRLPSHKRLLRRLICVPDGVQGLLPGTDGKKLYLGPGLLRTSVSGLPGVRPDVHALVRLPFKTFGALLLAALHLARQGLGRT